MKSIFEDMGGTYRREGDYLIPNLERLRQEKLAAEQTAQAVQEEADPVTEPKEEQKTA